MDRTGGGPARNVSTSAGSSTGRATRRGTRAPSERLQVNHSARRGGQSPTHRAPGAPLKMQRQFVKRCIRPSQAHRWGQQRTDPVQRSWTGSEMALCPIQSGVGAIDPCAERLDGTAQADGIGGSAVRQYSPIGVRARGEYDGFGATG